jgi:hypothetical protein
MQGIEILNKTPVLVQPDWAVGGAILSIVFFIAFMVLTFIFGEDGYGVLAILFAILSCITFILALICCDIEVKSTDGRYRYEAIIDESVSLQDIYERYNVIEQEGKKWILEDKESN